MLISRPTLVFKLLIPHQPTLYLLPLPPHHHLSLLAVLLCLLPPLPHDSLRVLQWNAGSLQARSTELLRYFLSSHPVDLICIQESNLNSSFSFQIPGFSALRSDCTYSRSGILPPDATHASGSVIIFVRQGLSFSELSISSLSSLDPYSDHVEVNISLNDSSSLSFLNVHAPLIRSSPTDGRTNSFSPSIFSSSRNHFFLGGLQLPSPLCPSGVEVFDWVISSDLLPLNDPDLSFANRLLPFLAPGWYFRTWVLTTYQFFNLSLSLRTFTPTSFPLPSTFRKLAGMILPPTLTLTALLQRHTRLFLFSLLLLSSPLWH